MGHSGQMDQTQPLRLCPCGGWSPGDKVQSVCPADGPGHSQERGSRMLPPGVSLLHVGHRAAALKHGKGAERDQPLGMLSRHRSGPGPHAEGLGPSPKPRSQPGASRSPWGHPGALTQGAQGTICRNKTSFDKIFILKKSHCTNLERTFSRLILIKM